MASAGVQPPVETISAGTVLHRVHGAKRGAEYYGAKEASWRYDDPARTYGVIYLGRGIVGPFAETLMRDLYEREVLWSRVQTKRQAWFSTTRDLRLAKVHGDGLAWFGVTSDQVKAPHDPSAAQYGYEITQRISARVYAEHPSLDGIQYRSRYNDDEICVAIFERSRSALSLLKDDAAFDKAWVQAIVEGCGFKFIDA